VTQRHQKGLDMAKRVTELCDVLLGFVPADADAFLTDVPSQWAVEMGLIRIGEAVNRIPDEVLERFSGQPWRQIAAMRNLAAHQYDDLEPRRVWRTVTRDVPLLRTYLVDTVIPALTSAADRPNDG
jgi:uncharacterized protein with HEPN domain